MIAVPLLIFYLLAAFSLPQAAAAPAPRGEEFAPLPLEPESRSAEGGLSLSRPHVLTLSLPGTSPVAADESSGDSPRVLAPWSHLGRNALAVFSGPRAILHLSAAAATFLIVETGLDTRVHNYFARNTFFDRYSLLGVVQGSMVPVLLGGTLLGSGLIGGSSRLATAGSAVLQASLLAVCYSSVLKALTGRRHPEPVVYEDDRASREFRFGILRGGVFWGWPSGHMLGNTAAVTSLLTFLDETWLDIAGGLYLGYLFLSVVSHGNSSMHWFSDAVAGTLMGYAVGSTVGRDFRRRFENRNEKQGGAQIAIIPQLSGLTLRIAF